MGVTIGSGLLGLEAAKSMLDMNTFRSVKLVDRNRWVLARQLDGDAGTLVTEKIRELGLDVLLQKRVARIDVDGENRVKGIVFEDGEWIECSCICFAVRYLPENCAIDALTPVIDRGKTTRRNRPRSRPSLFACRWACRKFRAGDVRVWPLRHWRSASWENKTFGIIVPGIEMADVLSYNLTRNDSQPLRYITRPDLSTKLKLLGIDVASFGDFFADRYGPKLLPGSYSSKPESNGNGIMNGIPILLLSNH